MSRSSSNSALEPDPVHGPVPHAAAGTIAATTDSPQAQGALHGTIPVHGPVPHAAAGMIARRRGAPVPVYHPVTISRDEGHSHTMVTRRSAGVAL
jgi:hypothetical protein